MNNTPIKCTFTEVIDEMDTNEPARQFLEGMKNAGCRVIYLKRKGTTKLSASTTEKPTLVIICDDDNTPSGPSGWDQNVLASVLKATASIHLQGMAPDNFFEMLPIITLMHGKTVLINTPIPHFHDWATYLQDKAANIPCMIFAPDGYASPCEQCNEEDSNDIL